MKMDDELWVLEQMKMDVTTPESGCCGMAGAFGFEREHYDVSLRCVSGFAQKLITPKAFANSSPGLFQPWGKYSVDISTLEAFANSFGVEYFRWLGYPGFKPWAEISELRWSSPQTFPVRLFVQSCGERVLLPAVAGPRLGPGADRSYC